MESMTFSSPPWWSKDTVAVVTGANKGVGFEIVRLLAQQGLTVVLTARDTSRGQAAVDALKKEGLELVWFHQLDIQNPESVESLATWLKSKFGQIDILVNNAAIGSGPHGEGDFVDYESAKAIIDTNYHGVKNVTEALLPLLRQSSAAARIVNVTSGSGAYERLRSETLKQLFRDENNYTQDFVDSMAKKYLENVQADRWNEEGWVGAEGKASPMYSVSKILLNAYSIVLAKSFSKSQTENHQILVSSFTPGLTSTDMLSRTLNEGGPAPPGVPIHTPEEGADTGVWLALLPKEELAKKHGKFFRDREEFSSGGSIKVC